MLTIPMIDGWRRSGRTGANSPVSPSRSTARRPADDAQWFADAGNGVLKSTGKPITGNDPARRQCAQQFGAFSRSWVQASGREVGRGRQRRRASTTCWTTSPASGTARTATSIRPGRRWTRLRAKILDYAAKIKAVDPTALVVGPEEWGWTGYLYSGYDSQWGGEHKDWSHLPDRAAHGNMDAMPWLLDQLHQENMPHRQAPARCLQPALLSAGRRVRQRRRYRDATQAQPLDPLAVGSRPIPTRAGSTARSQLIPRMKGWVAPYYPGTQIGITEYNWGAESHINGATAQADILGIFGREGLDMATRWTTPDNRHADLQGDEDLPQLRRQEVGLRRDQRPGHRPESGQPVRVRRAARRPTAR